MLAAFTADLHYGKQRSGDQAVRDLAKRLDTIRPDVLVIAGDIAIADPRALIECLELFDLPGAHLLAIPGNHDLWSLKSGADSLAIFERLFTRSTRLAGFQRLDGAPVVVDGTAFVGSIGWYDYSFADERLQLTKDQYERKVYPGTGSWNDRRFIRWNLSDEQFLNRTLEHLRADLASVREQAQRIVAVTHVLPFEQLVERRGFRAWMFQNAYMGSRRIGEVLIEEASRGVPVLSVSGHSHRTAAVQVSGVTALTVGSTYHRKRALLVKVGEHGFPGPENIGAIVSRT